VGEVDRGRSLTKGAMWRFKTYFSKKTGYFVADGVR
jgi:hypothetical protein